MTKFIVNNRTDALKPDIDLVFYENRLSNFPLSFADASHEFQIHVFVGMLTIKFSQWACVNFCSYCVRRRRTLPNFVGLFWTLAKALRGFWAFYRAGSYDVTFSLRKGFCLVRHKLLSSSRTSGEHQANIGCWRTCFLLCFFVWF